jgi:hypothetical protein
MAQFKSELNNGQVTRLGNKTTGAQAKVNGWTCGIEVIAEFNKETGKDEFTIYKTGGSHKNRVVEKIATIESP